MAEQRCWVHKTANVLNKLPKSVQPKAKSDLKDIYAAPTREDANKAFDQFIEKYDEIKYDEIKYDEIKYDAKYAKACECLTKDRDVLLAFYDFPAQHWGHIRTTNPMESTFATIRLRHRRTKGSGSRRASLAMMFKLAESASERWRRLDGYDQITHVIEGRTFLNGELQQEHAA